MRYLSIDNSNNVGGHPVSLNDFDSIQNGVFDIVRAIASMGYNDDGLAVIGIPRIKNITGTTFDHDAFWVVNTGNGLLVRVPPATNQPLSVAPGAKFYVRVTFTYGADDPVTYESAATKNVHAETSATLVHTASPGGNDTPLTDFNIADWVDSLLTEFLYSGVNITSGGYFSVRYRLVNGNTMLLYFRMKGTVEVTDLKIQMPFPYQLRSDFAQVIFGENPTNSETMMKVWGVADGTELKIDRLTGADLGIGNAIEIKGCYLTFEIKLRDSF